MTVSETDNDYMVFSSWIARYPYDDMTFNEVFQWLLTKPDAVCTQSETVLRSDRDQMFAAMTNHAFD